MTQRTDANQASPRQGGVVPYSGALGKEKVQERFGGLKSSPGGAGRPFEGEDGGPRQRAAAESQPGYLQLPHTQQRQRGAGRTLAEGAPRSGDVGTSVREPCGLPSRGGGLL